MDILNKSERSKAFTAFVFLFIITVGITITAIFFNAYFPFYENNVLKAENARMKREMQVQTNFSFQLEKVKAAVDSIGIQGKNDFFNEKLALSILADMYKQLPKDTLKNKVMYNNIIMTYKELIDQKRKTRHFVGEKISADSVNQINKLLKEEYNKMRIDLDVCRQLYQSK